MIIVVIRVALDFFVTVRHSNGYRTQMGVERPKSIECQFGCSEPKWHEVDGEIVVNLGPEERHILPRRTQIVLMKSHQMMV